MMKIPRPSARSLTLALLLMPLLLAPLAQAKAEAPAPPVATPDSAAGAGTSDGETGEAARAIAFEKAPGVLGISIRTLRQESVKAFPSESLRVLALGLEDIRLSPVAIEGRIEVNIGEELSFEGQSDQIPKRSRRLLDGIGRLLAENPDTLVHLANHTDDDGDAGYNLRLSQRRADAIKAYLVGRGVTAERIFAVGIGEAEPLVATGKRTPTRKERAKNRRTAMIIEQIERPDPAPEADPEIDPEFAPEADPEDPEGPPDDGPEPAEAPPTTAAPAKPEPPPEAVGARR